MFKISVSDLNDIYVRWAISGNPLNLGAYFNNRFSLSDEKLAGMLDNYAAYDYILANYGSITLQNSNYDYSEEKEYA